MDASPRVGIRELRNRVAAVVRRAEGGERIVVTVDGRPAARLVPIEPEGEPTLDDLVAAGLLRGPQRSDRPAAPDPADVPIDARVDGVLDELRGG
ncbi:MAG: type II toxin-antitoxin system prevent-host-death family antitoxin [Actinomycetota bacterium]